MHKIQLEQFEGPLDLLLQLIEKQKLQITEISLAKVTDQYLNYIDQSGDIASEEVADFLLTASKLIYLKSKYLLPNLELEKDGEADDLERQLKIYRQYYEASKVVNKLWARNRLSYTRQAPFKLEQEQGFNPPPNLQLSQLQELFQGILSRIEKIVNLPQRIIAKAVSIAEKIRHIKDLIKSSTKITFSSLLKDKQNKMEAIVSFLAMLELVKQREIAVSQDGLFSELHLQHKQVKEIEF